MYGVLLVTSKDLMFRFVTGCVCFADVSETSAVSGARSRSAKLNPPRVRIVSVSASSFQPRAPRNAPCTQRVRCNVTSANVVQTMETTCLFRVFTHSAAAAAQCSSVQIMEKFPFFTLCCAATRFVCVGGGLASRAGYLSCCCRYCRCVVAAVELLPPLTHTQHNLPILVLLAYDMMDLTLIH